jgi:hypothetical protein
MNKEADKDEDRRDERYKEQVEGERDQTAH